NSRIQSVAFAAEVVLQSIIDSDVGGHAVKFSEKRREVIASISKIVSQISGVSNVDACASIVQIAAAARCCDGARKLIGSEVGIRTWKQNLECRTHVE